MNEFIKILVMIAVCLSSLLIASIADDEIRNGAYRLSVILLIGIITGIALLCICLNLEVIQ
jgi:hypothetical protein